MKTIAALAAAVALAVAPATAGVLASDFGAARFQAVTNNTTAPATTTPTPAATPAPAPVSTDTTAPAPAPTNATTAAPDDGSNDDSLIRPLRDGEVIEQLPGLVLLQDATSAAASVAMTSTRAVAPWTFKSMGRQLVAAVLDDDPSSRTVACSSADNLPDQGKFNVLVAVSTCFDKKSFTYIQSWLASLGGQDARYFEGDDTSSVNFDIKFVDDGCDKPSWCKYDMVKEDDRKSYVATISIMVYSRGCKTIQKFCGLNQIPTTIGYVYNGPVTETVTPLTKTVNTLLPGYTPAQWVDDTVGFLGRFNPFGTARKLHCANLPGGVPTSYIQSKKRQCFCTCPVGTEMKNGACVPTTTPWDPLTGDEDCQCAWITKSDGYKLLTKYETNNVCMFKNLAISGTSGLLPVPMVVDNYVDHYRSNVGDNVSPLGSSPRIELMNQRVSVTVTNGPDAGPETVPAAVTNKYTWKTFQASTDAPINKLEFTHVGRYNVQLKATDYGSVDATCPACVLVVDSYRPTANPSFQCPKSVGDVTSELTATNVGLIQKATNGLKAFKTNALNDPCSPNTRCDEDALQTKKFVETDYSALAKNLDGASTFFDVEVVKADLRDRLSLSTSPFDSTQTSGLSTAVQDVCIRCIKASTTLKEWWTDYKCGSAQATAQCEGTASCALTQCLQVNGATLAIASANLKDSIKKSSLSVVKALAGNEKKSDTDLTTQFGLGTNVHIALECTKFPGATDPADPKCVYSSKLGDLIDFGATPAISALVRDALFNLADVRGFVAWRYRVDAGAWRLFDAANVESFSKSETSVTLEAWTKCGLVKSFTFKIVLHLNNKIQVCDKFNDMWYQATRETPKLPVNLDSLCMHPKSDFAEVTFDYHPNIGIVNSAFEMTINKVKCTLKYDGSGTNATIVDVSASPTSTFQIVKEFSIDGVSVGSTQPETTVFVACTFTYKRTLDATTDTQVCNRKFVIKDCTPPKISKPCPSDGKCDYNKCAAAKPADPRRDLYQACGGNRISQSADSKTIITTAETQCCPSCDTKYYLTKCKAIRDTPVGLTTDNAFIKRCEPEAVTPNTPTDNNNGGQYGSSGQYGQYSVLAAAVEDLQAQPTSTLALVGATAMVAVVALVVVRRRQRETAMIEEDAYYPLMG